jgi:exodeoxyribonuclease VII large subunit
MAGNGFFDMREKLASPRGAAAGATAASAIAKPDSALSVSQVTKLIDKAIRGGVPTHVSVRGEISNFNLNRGSGHAYFTLKDADACINCVMFRGEFERLKFMPQHGMELLAIGGVRVFASQGRYQLYVTHLEPLGKGALELAFQQLRAKLEAEGLFDPNRKKELPRYPSRIAIVTSRQTAALQDILKVTNRFPWVRGTLYHVPVQGQGCGAEIAAAITAVSRQNTNDLILLSRGGGSLEDRWGFNDESLARAIAASSIPVITGIGHEVDVSIADLVADYHAHTPTEAAQVATHWWRNVDDLLGSLTLRLHRQMHALLQAAHHRLNAVERHEIFRRPTDRIDDLRMKLDDRQRSLLQAVQNKLQSSLRRLEKSAATLAEWHPRNTIALQRAHLNATQVRLQRAMQIYLQRKAEKIKGLSIHLEAISPQRVLERGYTVTRLKKTGQIIRNSSQLHEGDAIMTRFGDGEVESIVEDRQQPRLFE